MDSILFGCSSCTAFSLHFLLSFGTIERPLVLFSKSGGQPAIFVDRDGVINSLIGPKLNRGPLALDELSFLGEPEIVLAGIKGLGFVNIIITNQPDLSRGGLTLSEHNLICERVLAVCPSVSKIYTCPHDNDDLCDCRKPKPGLIDQATQEFQLDLSKSWLVGDKWTDILAGKARGLATVLLRNDASWNPTSQGSPPDDLLPDFEISDLGEVYELLGLRP